MTRLRALFRRRRDAPLDCHAVAEQLQEYLDGEIDADTADRIAEHLEVCRACGLEAETYERIKAALQARRSDVPADSVERLREFGERLARGEEPSTS
ncbi:MAG: zf-HC2 domain-containing protein [Ilumatobacteraceae bacterium]